MKKTSLLWCCCAVLMLAACGGGDEGGGGSPDSGTPGTPDSGTPSGTSITVRGKVVDGDGKVVGNASVLVLGLQPVTTDASGAFSVAGVTTPYDIVAVNGSKQSAVVYKGVTRQDPTLSLTNPTSAPSYSATVTGSVSGAAKPSATVSAPAVLFVSADGSSETSTYDSAASSFSTKPSWTGAATTTGSLFAIQGERTSASSTTYTKFTGFGRRDNVSLSNSATVSNQNVTLSSVANSTLAGSITVPSGLTLLNNSVSLRFAPSTSVPLFSETPSSNTFSYVVPVVAQSTFGFTAIALSSNFSSYSIVTKSDVAAGTNNLSLSLLVPPSPGLPADKATSVTRSSEFSWSSTPGGVNLVAFVQRDSSGTATYTVTVVTTQTRTTIPDLSALGLALPASASLSWMVQEISPLASVDVLLSARGASSEAPAGLTEFYISAAAARTFTTSSTP